MLLGVNIDHIATLRQARRGIEPSPVLAALVCEAAGADSIVAHLREDRRHIQDEDIFILRKTVRTKFNLEMSSNEDIVNIACAIKPDQVTLVPEKREELTTEGGLDVVTNPKKIKDCIYKLKKNKIAVSIFIDPDKSQIKVVAKIGAKMIEIHTGKYANARTLKDAKKYFEQIKMASKYAKKLGLKVFAGHGLNYQNSKRISEIPQIEELNIGHSIISRACMVGLSQAVKEMKEIIN